MRDHAVRRPARRGTAADFPGPRDELHLAAARSRVALDVMDEVLVEIGYPVPPCAGRRCAREWFGTRERAEGGHAMHVAVPLVHEHRATIFARHPGVHREGVGGT